MKKELDYFKVGNKLGWSQDDFKEYWMKIGGCGAVTACDTFVLLKKYFGKDKLYPYPVDNVEFNQYYDFAKSVRPYLRPRFTGIDTLDIYIDGVNEYLQDVGETNVQLTGFEGYNSLDSAKEKLKSQIDKGFVVPMLVLQNKNKAVNDYVWHCFILAGYEEIGDTLMVKTITYGHYRWVDFGLLWDSGHRRKGGLILYNLNENNKN